MVALLLLVIRLVSGTGLLLERCLLIPHFYSCVHVLKIFGIDTSELESQLHYNVFRVDVLLEVLTSPVSCVMM